MKSVVCFGEIMARLQPPGHLRFRQVMPGTLELTFAGAEANAAVTISALGGEARFVTALPRHEIAEACLANLRAARVRVEDVVRSDTGRFGLYFVEAGANQRGGNGDRASSAPAARPSRRQNVRKYGFGMPSAGPTKRSAIEATISTTQQRSRPRRLATATTAGHSR